MSELIIYFDTHLKLFLIANVVIYALATIIGMTKFTKSAVVSFVAAFVFNGAIIALNWIGCGHPPFGNMYHVLTVLPCCMLPIWLFLVYKGKLNWLLPYFAFAATICLTGTIFMKPSVSWDRIPALQSIWFVPHVFVYMVSYALMAVACLVSIVALIKDFFNKKDDEKLLKYNKATFLVTTLGLPFMTFGLLSGAIWADAAWGIYWGWDAKETWALITWFLYLGYLHVAWLPEFKRKSLYLSIFAFVVLIVTFLLVNLLPKFASSIHSYA